MGYDFHITRKEYWSDEDGPKISLAEWEAFVQGYPTIQIDSVNPKEANYVLQFDQEHWPLWWHERGEIWTKNPNPKVIVKLVEIAASLGAKLLGDDDEIYGIDPAHPEKFEVR